RLIAAYCRQRLGRLPVLDPRQQRLQLSGRSRTRAATTVPDTGCKEQSDKCRGFFRSTHLLLNTLVVIHRPVGGDELIRQAVPHNRLAPTTAKLREVWVIGSDHQTVLFQ